MRSLKYNTIKNTLLLIIKKYNNTFILLIIIINLNYNDESKHSITQNSGGFTWKQKQKQSSMLGKSVPNYFLFPIKKQFSSLYVDVLFVEDTASFIINILHNNYPIISWDGIKLNWTDMEWRKLRTRDFIWSEKFVLTPPNL